MLKLCNRCQRIIPYPNTYCEICQPVIQQEREKNQMIYKRRAGRKSYAKQDKKYVRFYQSPEWRMLSAKMLQEKGYRCENCKQIATQVHHVVKIQIEEGWNRRFDVSNVKCLCGRCHNKAHGRFGTRK